ncbi:hypothetical protein SHKM778_80270 [Streptomyces sp. KM77-8]|uniref:Spore protein YkvP/CgeB glycosyl transferase-like domain-containing protein n=1 Tax=Streptomyces haneummycinicus TaxID=3074435 RepID=A0AAT9HVS0_9ACTN
MSEAERATGVHAGITGRWTVVPNGIDPGRFRPAPAGPVRDGLTRLAGLPARAPLAVCVGRLCRQKGQDVLLRAWDAVRQQVPGARLVLVGDGPDRDRLRAAAPRRCCSRGPSPTPPLVPGRRCRRTAVPLGGHGARPAGGDGVRAARGRHGRRRRPRESAAFLRRPCVVPPEDPEALAGAVGALLNDPALRASLGERGRRHVLTLHDVRHTARAVSDVYHDLLGSRPAAPGARPVRTGGDAGAGGTTPPVEPSEHRESIHS